MRDNISIRLDQDSAAKAGRKSFQYDAGFTLEPGRYHMKFVVRENVTGKMGTFETRFTVPDLSADTSGLKLSTIIWSSQREPLEGGRGCGREDHRKGAPANPLIVGEEKVVPNITQCVPAQPEPVRHFRRLRCATGSGGRQELAG